MSNSVCITFKQGVLLFVFLHVIYAPAFAGPIHDGKAYLLSTESLSHSEIADQLSEGTGRSIKYQDISPEEYQQELETDAKLIACRMAPQTYAVCG